jgi:mannose/fructose/N-acetylgalactosamine-specific phosphotransferase system component IIC
MSALVSRLGRSSAVHVSFAFLAMGGWALFANRDYPLPRMLLAGLVQGTLSACLTLFLKAAVEALSRRFSGTPKFVLPPLMACLGSASILVAIHTISGTPEIFKTIAVPLAVSTSYAAIYNYSISSTKG